MPRKKATKAALKTTRGSRRNSVKPAAEPTVRRRRRRKSPAPVPLTMPTPMQIFEGCLQILQKVSSGVSHPQNLQRIEDCKEKINTGMHHLLQAEAAARELTQLMSSIDWRAEPRHPSYVPPVTTDAQEGAAHAQ